MQSIPYKLFMQGKEAAPEDMPIRHAALYGVDVNRAEVDILYADGSITHLYGYARPLFDHTGKTRGAIGVYIDISERKQLERALREGEENFRVALKHLAVRASRVDRELRYTWVYNAHPDFHADQILGKRTDEISPAPEVRELAGLKRQVLETGQGIHQEYTMNRSDGPHIYALTIEPFFNVQGEIEGVTSAAVDITDYKRVERELRQARDNLERRVAERTQSLVEAYIHLQQEMAERQDVQAEVTELRRRLAEGQEVERLQLAQELHDMPIQELYAGLYAVAALVNTRLDSPQSELARTIQAHLTEANRMLRELCNELRPPTLENFGLAAAIRSHTGQFRKAHPAIVVEFEQGPAELQMPPQTSLVLFRIYQQAMHNIVRHAHAQHVWVRLQWEAAHVVLEVEDDGQGFVPPARWVELARAKHFGLVGSAERAETVGGIYSVRSAPGQGTTVSIRVPITEQTV
jgi:signal transduction histidine kinase